MPLLGDRRCLMKQSSVCFPELYADQWQVFTVHALRQRDCKMSKMLVIGFCRRIVQYCVFFECLLIKKIAFFALTLLIRCQEEHLACRMTCWCGYLSRARCRLFAYGPAGATASQNPIISCRLASFKSILVLPFWYWLTQVVLEKRPLNGCSSSSSSSTEPLQ